MFGLTQYGSGSDDSDSEEAGAAKAPLQLLSGATLVVKKSTKSSGLLPAFYSDDDEEEEVGSLLGNFASDDGTIEIISSPQPNTSRSAADDKKQSTYRLMRLLPPEPAGNADAAIEGKIRAYLKKPDSFNLRLQGAKKFHNPYALNRIAEKYDIDQTASNYPTDLYNPTEWRYENYERIAREYQQQKLQKMDSGVPSVAVTVAEQTASAKQALAAAAMPPIRRKGSKWDQPQGGAPAAKKMRSSTDRVTAQRMHARDVANQLSASLTGGITIGETAAAKREATARLAVLQSQKKTKT